MDFHLSDEQVAAVCPRSADVIQAGNFGPIRTFAEYGTAAHKARWLPDLLAGRNWSSGAMLADPPYDLIVAVAGSSTRLQPELAVRPIMDYAGAAAPLAAAWSPRPRRRSRCWPMPACPPSARPTPVRTPSPPR